jgi:hypothetical protein
MGSTRRSSTPTTAVNRTRLNLLGQQSSNSRARRLQEGLDWPRACIVHEVSNFSVVAYPGIIHEAIQRHIEDMHADACPRDLVPDRATWMSESLPDEIITLVSSVTPSICESATWLFLPTKSFAVPRVNSESAADTVLSLLS